MTSDASPKTAEILLVLMPWDLPESFINNATAASPGLSILPYRVGMYDTEVPAEIPQDVWNTVTALFTWNALPPKDLAPKLQYIQLLSAGCNHVYGTPIFDNTDIAFCTANGVHPPQIAEWVITTFLAFQHHLYEHWDNQKKSVWVKPESDEDTEDAVGLRMGVLGYGCIGRQCARLGRALGMDVHAYTLHARPTPESRVDDSYVEPGLGDRDGALPSRWFSGKDQLDEFIAGVDLLIVTLPLTPLTRGMIGKDQLRALGRRQGFLSNAGRGPIVDSDALLEALNEGIIKGAALDVTDPEPLPSEHPLWTAKNVVITPHVSGNSTHYNERALKILTENLGRRAQGRSLINQVNKSLGY